MMTTLTFDEYLTRLASDGRLAPDDVRALADSPDILRLGMLADAGRRKAHGGRTTFLRVARCPHDRCSTSEIPPAAREVRLTGAPESLSAAERALREARVRAGDRTLSAFSWHDIVRLAETSGRSVAAVLESFRRAGLDALAELPLDAMTEPARALGALVGAGFTRLRLTMDRPVPDRVGLLLRAAELQADLGAIQAINPLPLGSGSGRPTTGYEDVKMVALARLAAPNVASIQVDWLRYGPKLAQVALTFGADDIDGVSGSDEAPEGRRRAPLEEVRRNIEAAGFEAVERDGRFAPLV